MKFLVNVCWVECGVVHLKMPTFCVSTGALQGCGVKPDPASLPECRPHKRGSSVVPWVKKTTVINASESVVCGNIILNFLCEVLVSTALVLAPLSLSNLAHLLAGGVSWLAPCQAPPTLGQASQLSELQNCQ